MHKIKDRARHHKGTTRPGTGPHGLTRDGTATSSNGASRYDRGAGVRFDTEEATGSTPYRPPAFTQVNPGVVGVDLFLCQFRARPSSCWYEGFGGGCPTANRRYPCGRWHARFVFTHGVTVDDVANQGPLNVRCPPSPRRAKADDGSRLSEMLL